MTFAEIKKTLDDFLAQNKDVSKEDVADMLIEKQKEWEIPDLDMGVLIYSIGAEDKITAPMIKAMQEKGLLELDEEEEKEEAPETEEKGDSDSEEVEEKVEEPEDKEETEKEEVRKLYNGN